MSSGNMVPLGYNQLTGFNAAAVSLGKGLTTYDKPSGGTNNNGVIAPGSGYRQGDTVAVTSGTPNGAAYNTALLRIEQVDPTTGAVLAFSIANNGSYPNGTLPTFPDTVTAQGNCKGTGLQVQLHALTDAPPLMAQTASMVPEGADVRWRDDGTPPTSSVGMLMKTVSGTGNNSVTEPYEYDGPLQQFQVIDTSAGTAKLNVVFYGPRRRQ